MAANLGVFGERSLAAVRPWLTDRPKGVSDTDLTAKVTTSSHGLIQHVAYMSNCTPPWSGRPMLAQEYIGFSGPCCVVRPIAATMREPSKYATTSATATHSPSQSPGSPQFLKKIWPGR